MMLRINEVEIKKQSWMEIIINKEDGCINGSLLADQIGVSLRGFLRLDRILHMKFLASDILNKILIGR